MSVLVLLKDIAPQYKSEDSNDYMLILGGRIESNNVMTMNSKLATALAGASGPSVSPRYAKRMGQKSAPKFSLSL